MRQRPVLCEAKHTYRQLYKDHVECIGEGNNSIHPADQTRQSHRQRFKGFEEYNYMVHLELDGNIIFQQARLHPHIGSTTIGSRIKVWIIGDLQPGLNSFFVLSNSKHRRTCCRMTSTAFFSCSGSCFSLAGNFQFPGNRRRRRGGGMNRYTSHTAHFNMYKCAQSSRRVSRDDNVHDLHEDLVERRVFEQESLVLLFELVWNTSLLIKLSAWSQDARRNLLIQNGQILFEEKVKSHDRHAFAIGSARHSHNTDSKL